jgi:hypothetical protein
MYTSMSVSKLFWVCVMCVCVCVFTCDAHIYMLSHIHTHMHTHTHRNMVTFFLLIFMDLDKWVQHNAYHTCAYTYTYTRTHTERKSERECVCVCVRFSFLWTKEYGFCTYHISDCKIACARINSDAEPAARIHTDFELLARLF